MPNRFLLTISCCMILFGCFAQTSIGTRNAQKPKEGDSLRNRNEALKGNFDERIRITETTWGAEQKKVKRYTIPYPEFFEEQIMWSEKIWRTVDLQEKTNKHLYYPLKPKGDRLSLFAVIKQEVLAGRITAYDVERVAEQDEFADSLHWKEVRALLSPGDSILNEIESKHIQQYQLKEEWYFDKNGDVVEIQILGIAPLAEHFNEDGDFTGHELLFWLYFPECRFAFSKSIAMEADGKKWTYDQVFQERMFNSYIMQNDNVQGRRINQYKVGRNARYESDQHRERLFNTEHDAWKY